MVKKCLSRMSGKLSRTVLRREKGSNLFFLVDYTNKIFHKKLVDAGMTQSMSRVSRCIDNGPMEAFWGMMKSEMYYLKKFSSYDELEAAVNEYIEYYNNHRYQKRLNCMTPIEYRQYLSSTAA